MGPRLRDVQHSVELPPGAAKPPGFVSTWQPRIALAVGALGLVGIVLGAGTATWETKAHAQEVAATQAAAVVAAKADCKASLSAEVAATRTELVGVQVRLARLEVSSQWQEAILRQIARKLDVAPAVPPLPAPAPVTPLPPVTP
jgi:hypothetical protein